MHTNKITKREIQKTKLLLLITAVLVIPFLVFAHGAEVDETHHDENVTVSDTAEAEGMPKIEIPIKIEEQTNTHGVGDGHNDHEHAPVTKVPWWQNTQWWSLFLGSLFLMTLLSWWVYVYLKEDK